MTNAARKGTLTPARRRLIELIQGVNYGRIENLEVRDGEPVFDPPPTVVRLFLFGRRNGPNVAHGKDDFALKGTVTELFDIFDRERSLSVRELIVDDGLPVRMTVAGWLRA